MALAGPDDIDQYHAAVAIGSGRLASLDHARLDREFDVFVEDTQPELLRMRTHAVIICMHAHLLQCSQSARQYSN